MEGSERISESPATLATNNSGVLLEFEVRSEPDPITGELQIQHTS
jgi:hypothetical protein